MKYLYRWLLLGYFLLIICGRSIGATTEEEVLTIGIVSSIDIEEISPLGKAQRSLAIIKNDLFEMLVDIDEEGSTRAGVAESWELSEDEMSWVFHLRKDAYWSDGVPVTAGDFVFAFDYWPDEARKATSSSRYKIVGFSPKDPDPLGVTALDDYTLKIDMITPRALELQDLTYPSFAPLPRHAAPTELANWSEWPQHPSNGSFSLLAIDKEKRQYVLQANPYARQSLQPGFSKVVHQFASLEELGPLFNEGKVDLINKVDHLQSSPFTRRGAQLVPIEESFYFYALNKKSPKLADIRIRRALTLAVDSRAIVQRLYTEGDFAHPAYYMVRPERLNLPTPVRPDLETATELLKEAGYDKSAPLQLALSSNYTTNNRAIALLLKEQLERLPVVVTVDTSERNFRDFKKKRSSGDFEMIRISFSASDQSIRGAYNKCLRKSTTYCGYFEDDSFKDLLQQAELVTDKVSRKELLRQANQLLVDDYSIIPVFHRFERLLLSERVSINPDKVFKPRPPSAVFQPTAASKVVENQGE